MDADKPWVGAAEPFDAVVTHLKAWFAAELARLGVGMPVPVVAERPGEEAEVAAARTEDLPQDAAPLAPDPRASRLTIGDPEPVTALIGGDERSAVEVTAAQE